MKKLFFATLIFLIAAVAWKMAHNPYEAQKKHSLKNIISANAPIKNPLFDDENDIIPTETVIESEVIASSEMQEEEHPEITRDDDETFIDEE
ncbi:MAG: hypothetical protein IJ689_02560 [Alphaproteobacteria bacterium]|nr:hypothetical protein [Alphaproteobacteria bacterium]